MIKRQGPPPCLFFIRKGLERLEEIEKFFKLPKSIVKHDILHTKNSLSLRLFLTIVGHACYKDGVQVTNSNIILMRGQWLRSNRKLQKDLGASPTTLTAAIRWLEKKNLLRTETTKLGTIFTIKNFDVYQGKQEKTEQMSVTHRVTLGGRCYPESNARCYSDSNNTKNYKQTKNLKEDSNKPINSIGGQKHDERDTSVINWNEFPKHLRF